MTLRQNRIRETFENPAYLEVSPNMLLMKTYIAPQHMYPPAVLPDLCISVCHFDTTSR